MNGMKQYLITFVIFAFTINAHAALYDRGNGMIYDSTQNITWLQDANYAYTSGYATVHAPGSSGDDTINADGSMSWAPSKLWANTLVFAGISGWRLPSVKLLAPSELCFSYDGACDLGYNNTRSELGHLFGELGNKWYYDVNGNNQAGYGFIHTTFADAGTGQTVSFLNVQNNNAYWEAEQYSLYPDRAWNFAAQSGLQSAYYKFWPSTAWAVHDGDIAAVPVPAAAWLFGSGLLGLVGAARRWR